MRTRELLSIYRDISVMPFYAEHDQYHVDMSSLTQVDRRIDNFYRQSLRDRPMHNEMENIVGALAIFINEYLKFKNDLRSLSIAKDDFFAYMRQSKAQGGVLTYFDIKERLRYAIIPVLHIDDFNIAVTRPVFTLENESVHQSHNVILNHKNPFADINIQNQEFIYPDSKGKFQTLRFNVGYTMGKLDMNEKHAVVLQPDFKISKTSERNNNTSTITMDDTITTPMPEQQDGRELLYI